ncbi:MAG: cytochrome c3 family protein [Candidatus Omnitrophica bacterium]|nr:cytochrome c3 family protein [Candidatus Omnitrophota bacterium]
MSLKRFVLTLLLASLWAGCVVAADGDVVFKREGQEGTTPPAVFPHWIHRIRYRCYACHASLFEMKAGAVRITMDDIMAGKFCGVCHNGKTAWAVTFETCARCHKGQ